jgi:hypothetical protein
MRPEKPCERGLALVSRNAASAFEMRQRHRRRNVRRAVVGLLDREAVRELHFKRHPEDRRDLAEVACPPAISDGVPSILPVLHEAVNARLGPKSGMANRCAASSRPISAAVWSTVR